MLKSIGILREEKQPVDKRTPLVPEDCKKLMEQFPGLKFYVQPSQDRCYTSEEYKACGVEVKENFLACDLILGVKEIPIEYLIPRKRYMFFSHTTKKQKYNLKLLQSILDDKIELIDYEHLTDDSGKRLVAFGYYAGVVGAYNAIWTAQQKFNKKLIARLYNSGGYKKCKDELKNLEYKNLKFVITGTGRVSQGAQDVLKDAGIEEVSPEDFLEKKYDHAVFTALSVMDMFEPKFKHILNERSAFNEHPLNFKSSFVKYANVADVLINAIYWDSKFPKLFTNKDMKYSEFNLKVISDITCDLSPNASIPTTLRITSIEQPIFGFLPLREKIVEPFTPKSIDIISISNLPSEIPIEASNGFSRKMTELIIPEFFKKQSDIIERATVTKNGDLTHHYNYLESYVYNDEYRASRMNRR